MGDEKVEAHDPIEFLTAVDKQAVARPEVPPWIDDPPDPLPDRVESLAGAGPRQPLVELPQLALEALPRSSPRSSSTTLCR